MSSGCALSSVHHTAVQTSTCIVAGRVFEFVHGMEGAAPVVTPANIGEVVQTLLASLQDEPHIAEKVCYAFSQLAAGCKLQEGPSLLSPYFKEIIGALLATVRLMSSSPASHYTWDCLIL